MMFHYDYEMNGFYCHHSGSWDDKASEERVNWNSNYQTILGVIRAHISQLVKSIHIITTRLNYYVVTFSLGSFLAGEEYDGV